MQITEEKRALRQQMKLARNSLQNKTQLSEVICNTLLETELYKNCGSIFLYASAGSEVETELITKSAFSLGKKIAFPKCIDNKGNMKFYLINSLSELKEDMYGIMAPVTHCEAGCGNELSLCIVPGLAFSSDGYRLGYGKGYYDRFLSEFKGVSIGFCYDACIRDSIPKNEYDKKVNYLITDKRIYNFT